MTKDFHNEPGFQSEQNKPVAPSLESTDPSYRPGGGGGSRTGAVILGVLAILIAIGVGVFTWVVYNDMSNIQQKLENKNAEVNKLIEEASGKMNSSATAKQQEMQDEIDKVQQQLSSFLAENKAQLEQQKQLLQENINSALRDAEARMQKLLQQTANHKQQWALDEVEYMIRLANLNLTLGTNYKQTVQLLDMADKKLAQIENPELNKVRKALSNDITKLKAAPNVDVIGLISKLNAISDQVQRLPILPNKKFTKNTLTDKKAPDTKGTWRNHVDKTMKNLRSMFVVRKLDGPVLPLLTPAQLVYLKENIRLKLSQAEWAALHQESALYRQNLELAKEWLNNYNNHDRAAVKSLQAEISELEKINVKPNRPDILSSLTEIEKTLESISGQTKAAPINISTTPITVKTETEKVDTTAAKAEPEVSVTKPKTTEQAPASAAPATSAAKPSDTDKTTTATQTTSPAAEEQKQTEKSAPTKSQTDGGQTLSFGNPGNATEAPKEKTTTTPKAQTTTAKSTEQGFVGPEADSTVTNKTTAAEVEKEVQQKTPKSTGGTNTDDKEDNPFITSAPQTTN